MRYIIGTKDFTPVCLGDNKLYEFDIYNTSYNYTYLYADTQFKWSIISSNVPHTHGYNNRLNKYTFINGLIFKESNYELIGILCQNNKMLIRKIWMTLYPNDFKRLKSALKEGGINTRKDIYYLDDFLDYCPNVLSPTIKDFDRDYQKQLSGLFLESVR